MKGLAQKFTGGLIVIFCMAVLAIVMLWDLDGVWWRESESDANGRSEQP